MHFDWTINITGLLLAVLTAGVIPLVRVLVTTLREIRQHIGDLQYLVVGAPADDGSGLVRRMRAVERETLKNRERLGHVESELGMKIQDRT